MFDRIRVSLIRWMRNIVFEVLIYMEKKQIRLNIAIRKRSTKKVDNERRVFNAGRQYERKILIEILQRERDRAQSLRSR